MKARRMIIPPAAPVGANEFGQEMDQLFRRNRYSDEDRKILEHFSSYQERDAVKAQEVAAVILEDPFE
jgi:hypothetical protein